LVVPLATITAWARLTILDSDRFSATLTPLASDPEMQMYLTDQIGNLIVRQAVAQRVPVIPNGPTERLIRTTVASAVRSSYFPIAWGAMLRATHTEVQQLLKNDLDAADGLSDGLITVDVGPLIEQIDTELVKSGVNLNLTTRLTPTDRQVTLFRSRNLDQVRWFTGTLDRLGFLLPFLAIVIAVGAIGLAPRRIAALRWIAVGTGIGFVLVMVTDIGARFLYLRSIGDTLPETIATLVFDTVVQSLLVISVTGLLIAAVWAIGLTIVERRFRRQSGQPIQL